MKAYELIMETVLRKTYLRVIHAAWFGIYAAVFLIPFPPGTWTWGSFVFVWSGCLLPVLVSAGIFGNDVASGRISLLITKPIRLGELYIYRLIGLSLQGAVHLIAVGTLILILHLFTNRGSTESFLAWLLVSWLIFNTWAALSTTLSVVVQREHNAMLLFFATTVAIFGISFVASFYPDHRLTAVFLGVVRWACPPVELMGRIGLGLASLRQSLDSVAHSLMLTVLYGVIGVILLGRREFKYAREG
jgi:ABC-type transport system involved in multi-copper enzyme maturation permease subunit